ncbi:phage tail collar domain-containing protein [Lasius niger]|uniref:Phage tail collar domain-containing protein n=1 Tax=Lasius niger TaxID=67767 RepID=A0A0J7KE96_LASNI|nr:phage tail collar domain-containing protein [Lasius niger]
MTDNTTNLQNNISNLDQDIDSFIIDEVDIFEPLNPEEEMRVIEIFNSEETLTNCENNNIVQCLNSEKSGVYERSISCNNSEASEDGAQKIGDAPDENNPSPTAAREITVATTNYTEGSTNEVAEGIAHPISSPNIERVAKEIGDGRNDNLESPIDTSDTGITQTGKIEGVQQQKTKATVLSISSVFKETLFWPSALHEANSKETNSVRRCKEKVPAVVSSLQWKEYYKEKENKKQEVLLQKEEKKGSVKKKQEKF